ncbi:nitrate reductase molybdenum cofactor assembly chaperone [Lederbergia graminis]|uniref:Nitrate reductase molybdenum cofactor assembly chaperone n=1 Tax=Lederbergia graminis TaxID=735518 RepID=A0ABW0LHD4_9BACI
MNQKQKAYSLISTLLQYPEQEWIPLVHDLNMHEEFPDDEIRFPLQQFIRYVTNTSYEELCGNYVYTFDFYDKTTLYLTYSVFKDNRDRGPVLVELRNQMYELGMEFTSEELPDYLPLVLECASIISDQDADKLLRLHLRSIRNLYLELQGIDSPYRLLLEACINCIEKDIENEKVS